MQPLEVKNFGKKEFCILLGLWFFQTAGFIISLHYGFAFTYVFLSLILINLYSYKHYYEREKKIKPYWMSPCWDYFAFISTGISFPMLLAFAYYFNVLNNYEVLGLYDDSLLKIILNQNLAFLRIPNLFEDHLAWALHSILLSIFISFCGIVLSIPLWIPMIKGWPSAYRIGGKERTIISLLFALGFIFTFFGSWPVTNFANPNDFIDDSDFLIGTIRMISTTPSFIPLSITAVIGFINYLFQMKKAQSYG